MTGLSWSYIIQRMSLSRRDFIKGSFVLATGAALAGCLPNVNLELEMPVPTATKGPEGLKFPDEKTEEYFLRRGFQEAVAGSLIAPTLDERFSQLTQQEQLAYGILGRSLLLSGEGLKTAGQSLPDLRKMVQLTPVQQDLVKSLRDLGLTKDGELHSARQFDIRHAQYDGYVIYVPATESATNRAVWIKLIAEPQAGNREVTNANQSLALWKDNMVRQGILTQQELDIITLHRAEIPRVDADKHRKFIVLTTPHVGIMSAADALNYRIMSPSDTKRALLSWYDGILDALENDLPTGIKQIHTDPHVRNFQVDPKTGKFYTIDFDGPNLMFADAESAALYQARRLLEKMTPIADGSGRHSFNTLGVYITEDEILRIINKRFGSNHTNLINSISSTRLTVVGPDNISRKITLLYQCKDLKGVRASGKILQEIAEQQIAALNGIPTKMTVQLPLILGGSHEISFTGIAAKFGHTNFEDATRLMKWNMLLGNLGEISQKLFKTFGVVSEVFGWLLLAYEIVDAASVARPVVQGIGMNDSGFHGNALQVDMSALLSSHPSRCKTDAKTIVGNADALRLPVENRPIIVNQLEMLSRVILLLESASGIPLTDISIQSKIEPLGQDISLLAIPARAVAAEIEQLLKTIPIPVATQFSTTVDIAFGRQDLGTCVYSVHETEEGAFKVRFYSTETNNPVVSLVYDKDIFTNQGKVVLQRVEVESTDVSDTISFLIGPAKYYLDLQSIINDPEQFIEETNKNNGQVRFVLDKVLQLENVKMAISGEQANV